MELNREQCIDELDFKTRYAKFVGTDGVSLSAKCAQFCLEHAQFYEQKLKELTMENERLRAENEALAISEVKECEISQMLVYRIRDKHPAVMAVIADTVRKVADLLWQGESEKLNISVCGKYYDKQKFIDQITKELVGKK